MKTLVVVMALVLGTAVGTGTFAFGADGDSASIRRMESEWTRSLVNRDTKWFEDALADDWTIVLPDGWVFGKQEFIAALQRREIGYSRVEVLDLKVRVYGDAVIATSRHDVSRNPRIPVEGDHERRTDVYVRINKEWKCVTTHVTPLNRMMYTGP